MLKDALDLLGKARSFALLGASAEPGKYGHKVFSALRGRYRVFPVNPKRTEIDGAPCYASYTELPERPDAAILALAPAVTAAMVPQLIAQGTPLLWFPPECFTDGAVEACQNANVPVIYDICPVAAISVLERMHPPGGGVP